MTGDGCSRTTVAANSTCNFSVVYTATAVGHQDVGIAVADSASDSPQTLALTGTGQHPAPFTKLQGAVGCTTATLLWGLPSGVSGSWIVRNANHVPRNPHDGTRIQRTGPGLRAEQNLAQFHTYHYAIYAQYRFPVSSKSSTPHPGVLDLRTGRVCKPQRGAQITGTTPVIDWTPVPGATGYAVRIYNHGVQIQLWSKVTTISQYKVPASWRHNGVIRRLRHGQPYTIYVYGVLAKSTQGDRNRFLQLLGEVARGCAASELPDLHRARGALDDAADDRPAELSRRGRIQRRQQAARGLRVAQELAIHGATPRRRTGA